MQTSCMRGSLRWCPPSYLAGSRFYRRGFLCSPRSALALRVESAQADFGAAAKSDHPHYFWLGDLLFLPGARRIGAVARRVRDEVPSSYTAARAAQAKK